MYTHNSEMIRRVIYREEIFKQILEALGGRLRFVVSGGAPLDKRL